MSFGAKSVQSDKTVYSFKVKIKDLPTPHFEVSKKVGDKYQKLAETATRVSGNVIGVDAKVNKWEGQDIKGFTITLEDKDDLYFVNYTMNNLGQQVANSVLGLASLDDVELSLYQTRPKEGQTKSYAQGGVKAGTERGNWKFKLDELPAVTTTMYKGKPLKDSSAREDFLMGELKKFGEYVKSVRASGAPSKAPKSKAAKSEVPPAPTPADDDPFGDNA